VKKKTTFRTKTEFYFRRIFRTTSCYSMKLVKVVVAMLSLRVHKAESEGVFFEQSLLNVYLFVTRKRDTRDNV